MSLSTKCCHYLGCGSVKGDFGIKFHSFPTCRKQQINWIKASGNDVLMSYSEKTLRYGFHICSKHFEPDDYERSFSSEYSKIKPGAVPKTYHGPCNLSKGMTDSDQQEDVEERAFNLLQRLPTESSETVTIPSCDSSETVTAPSGESSETVTAPSGESSETVTVPSGESSETLSLASFDSPVHVTECFDKQEPSTSGHKTTGTGTPIKIYRRRNRIRTTKSKDVGRKHSKRGFAKLSAEKALEAFGPVLGDVLTMIFYQKIKQYNKSKVPYSNELINFAITLYFSFKRSGYTILRSFLPLPSFTSIGRYVKNFSSGPGVNSQVFQAINLQLNLSGVDKFCFLLIDEISLRKGLHYSIKEDLIYGFADNGYERSTGMANVALTFMLRGIVKKFSIPVAYTFCASHANFIDIKEMMFKVIKEAEKIGFIVLGVTTDQGANFRKVFRSLNVTFDHPIFSLNGNDYIVYVDPPHLIKSSRTLLLKNNLLVPGALGIAKWEHIATMYKMDRKNSLIMAPKLTVRHVTNLKFQNAMKVKLATQVLSHTCSATLNTYIANGDLPQEASATSHYCSEFNKLFDILNSSSPLDKVVERRPLSLDSINLDELTHFKSWLLELKSSNSTARNFHLNGWVQSINGVLLLLEKLSLYDIKYLSTRNLCQDPLELFFSRIRSFQSKPDCFQFSEAFKKACWGRLMAMSASANCEASHDQVGLVCQWIREIKLPDTPEEPRCLQGLFVGEDHDLGVSGGHYAAAYFGGFLIHYLQTRHLFKTNINLNKCAKCSMLISSTEDLNIHMYVSFKRYQNLVNLNRVNLKLCSDKFHQIILEWENTFLQYYNNFKCKDAFLQGLLNILLASKVNFLCHSDLFKDLIRKFINVRLKYVISRINQKYRYSSYDLKLKKLCHV